VSGPQKNKGTDMDRFSRNCFQLGILQQESSFSLNVFYCVTQKSPTDRVSVENIAFSIFALGSSSSPPPTSSSIPTTNNFSSTNKLIIVGQTIIKITSSQYEVCLVRRKKKYIVQWTGMREDKTPLEQTQKYTDGQADDG
jgi:hypothetical protein